MACFPFRRVRSYSKSGSDSVMFEVGEVRIRRAFEVQKNGMLPVASSRESRSVIRHCETTAIKTFKVST